MIQHCVNVPGHKLGYLGNVVEDRILVSANQTYDIHVLVMDSQVVALADEAFDDFNHGAFAQIKLKVFGARCDAVPKNKDHGVRLFGHVLFNDVELALDGVHNASVFVPTVPHPNDENAI